MSSFRFKSTHLSGRSFGLFRVESSVWEGTSDNMRFTYDSSYAGVRSYFKSYALAKLLSTSLIFSCLNSSPSNNPMISSVRVSRISSLSEEDC